MIIIESIPKSILDHGVDQNAIVHSVTITALHNCIRSEGHILHAACDNDICCAGNDLFCRHVDAVKTGAANYVNCNSGNFYRETGLDGSLSCYVLSLTCLDNAAHENFINLIRGNACALQSILDYQSAHVSSLHCAELSAHLTDCSTACAR